MRWFLYCTVLIVWLGIDSRGFAQESSSLDQSAGTVKTGSEQEQTPAEVAKAEAAISKQDWKTAAASLDSWLAGHPSDDRALFDDGYLSDLQGRNEEALKFYQKSIEANPQNFEAQVSLGLLLARLGRDAEARPALETATALNPELAPGSGGNPAKAQAWRALARLDLGGAESQPDAAQASIHLLEALKITPETVDDTLLAARIAEAVGDGAAEEAAYRRALAKNPDLAAAVTGLAHLQIAERKYNEVEPLLQTAIAKSPNDPALTAQLAAVYVAEDKADALPLLEQFHKNHAQETAITRMLARVMADAGEYDGSDRLYLELLAANPKDAELLTGHGQNLIRQHRYPEALKIFQSATDVDETDGDAWNGLAFAAFETHQPEVTLHALTVRSKYLPESATIYFLWATAYDTLHDKKQAAAYYHRFLDAAQGKLPDQEWQARQRLKLLDKAS